MPSTSKIHARTGGNAADIVLEGLRTRVLTGGRFRKVEGFGRRRGPIRCHAGNALATMLCKDINVSFVLHLKSAAGCFIIGSDWSLVLLGFCGIRTKAPVCALRLLKCHIVMHDFAFARLSRQFRLDSTSQPWCITNKPPFNKLGWVHWYELINRSPSRPARNVKETQPLTMDEYILPGWWKDHTSGSK